MPMSTPKFQESPADHHIQAKILQQLFGSLEPVSFSHLKPAEIENSLFMYHVRKLEDRGLVARTDSGFTLTPDGARWVNFTSPSRLKPRLTPRLLVNLIITTPDKKKVLLSRRQSAVAAHLTRYLLPSGFHKYGLPIREAAAVVAKSIIGEDAAPDYYDTYEVIYRFKDGYIHHWVLPTFTLQMEERDIPAADYYQPEWVPVQAVIDNQAGLYDQPLPDVIRKFMAGDKFDYYTHNVSES